MSKKDNLAMVPKYRFPEFKDSWEIISVSDIGCVYKGGIFSKADIDQNASNPCIHYGELFTKYNEIISNIYSKTNKKEGFKSKVGDILIPSSDVTPNGLAKASAIMVDDIILGGDMNIIRPNKKINSIFLSYLLNRSKNEIIKLVSGTTIKHIYPHQIITCKLPVVNNKQEQQKIADCLSSIDELISIEEKKLLLLNDYKKGWMQKLFPAEGKTVPEWRFPEFRDSGEWEETSINKITDYENGKAHENDIVDNGKYIVVNSKFISTEGEVIKYTNLANSLACKGDILMVLSDVPNGKALAKCYLVEKENVYTVNQRVCKIIPRKVNSILLFYTMNRNKYFLSFDDGVNQTNLKKDDVLSCSIFIPKPKEQQKIADFLSNIDRLIAKQKDRIKALKQHKKALMQGLFPTV